MDKLHKGICIRLANLSLIFVDLKFAKLFPMQKSLMIRKPALENRPTNILNCLDNHDVVIQFCSKQES